MYVGSADLMNRNLNGRIEVLTPIESAKIRQNILTDIMQLQLDDTEQTWEMLSDGSYRRLRRSKGAKRVDAQNAANHKKALYK